MKLKESEFHYKMAMAKYSVKDVAEMLGISTQAVYMKINGRTAWTVDEFYKICEAFKLKPAEAKRIFMPKGLTKRQP